MFDGLLVFDLWSLGGFLWDTELLFTDSFGEFVVLKLQLLQHVLIDISEFTYFSVSENKENCTFISLIIWVNYSWHESSIVRFCHVISSLAHPQYP